MPRIARLLALAWKWERMVLRGDVKDYAEIASRHGLSRARVVPDLQEATLSGEQVASSSMRRLADLLNWDLQRRLAHKPLRHNE